MLYSFFGIAEIVGQVKALSSCCFSSGHKQNYNCFWGRRLIG